ncbi:MAG: SH3 domain-containing protein [Bacteroidales bacterium]|nr:SH3 domain-containing protein [Bacteroidales bacterium]MCM1416832.1 SH3 domain-containing protein [bacterium]MCM1422413.1 SH3 domain-containing protein [bacterium]
MKIRKNVWGCVGGRRRIALLAAAALLLWGDPIVSRAEPTGTVIPNSVNIRKEPVQGSEVIGSSTAGKEISIRGQVESDGITWYQVYIDANTLGYVRADMIEKKGDETIPTVSVAADNDAEQSSEEGGEAGQDTSSQPTVSEGGATVAAQESMDSQYATTKTQTKVRPDPSTSNPHLDSLAPETQVVVSGKSEGSDSKTWYFVTYIGGNGSERTGFIRSDLLDLGELLPVEEPPEETPVEEPEAPAEPTVRNDYELKIETDSEGVATWYLYDNIRGQKEKLQPLLDAMSSAQSVDDEKETGAIVKQRIVIVVLSVLLALLAVAVIVLAFKLRDTYYEEDDEEEAVRKPAQRGTAERDERRSARREGAEKDRSAARRADGDGERAARRRTAEEDTPRRRADRQEGSRREREVRYEEDASAEAVRPAARRKAKNFLLDDDEFEFEFLNMDDKDLK